MKFNDFDGILDTDVSVRRMPVVAPLRFVAVDAPVVPQRRRAPRRQVVVAVAFERRHADRRERRPGIDGLLRTVLADDWR